ncbi:aminotransferase [Pseudomonas gingeri]|uniref:aminotransferase n=1 Tax=Pseudomonas gingeri TaxID=117681 RepID=UPI0015BC414C|nr:aminotransferase [Pseudomonas gingeri]NWD49591.1 aminotransferase [Pseudomonas gingeri]
MKRKAFHAICLAVFPVIYPLMILVSLVARLRTCQESRLVWGCAPIINNSYWSRAMSASGYKSSTYTAGYSYTINKREDYDLVSEEEYPWLHPKLGYYISFFRSLFLFDIFFISFQGYFLGSSPLWWLEAHLFRIAGKKIVVLPFGLDVYSYSRIRSTTLLHGLLMSIPAPARQQREIARRVDYWCANADFVIPGFAGPDGLGRWDVLVPSSLFIDTQKWTPSTRASQADGVSETVYIAHAPNHRGFKGSEFVVDVVAALKAEGLKVELVLIEKMPNQRVKEVLQCEVDILVEQLIATGHGLNGIEGMASALPVVSNLEDDDYILPLRRWSYFSECPVVSSSPESLKTTLRRLVRSPDLRAQLGSAGRAYVEKYHDFNAAGVFYSAVIDTLYGRRDSMINYCHPLLGEYVSRAPIIVHPLENSRLPQ